MRTIEEQWERFYRWGPFGFLALGTILAVISRDLLEMSPAEQQATAALVATALILQLLPIPGNVYFGIRTVLAFSLAWLNPFFAVYALMAYFDAQHHLTKRWALPGALLNSVTLAGSQAGGLPPQSLTVWAGFTALLLLHATLILIFGNLEIRQKAQAIARAETIEELKSTNARLEQALQENAGLQAQLLVQAREAGVNDERRRLAAEIHDTIAQGLAGIITQLQAAEDSEHVRRATDLAREGLREARHSVQNLAPTHLEHDSLPEALKQIVSEGTDLTITGLTITGTVEPLHSEIEATLLRIAQEALTNATRHAHADRIGVTLSYMDDEVALDIRDDGCGFTRPAGGFGLTAMRERAERVAGTLEIESEPGHGTAVSARVPLIRHG